MKIYFSILIVALWITKAIDAYPRPSANNVPNCADYEDGETLPDVNSCSQYYLCAGGQTIPQRCGLGLYYDAISGLCNRAFLVDCSINRLGVNLNFEIIAGNDVPSERATPTTPCSTPTTPCATPTPPCSTPTTPCATPTPTCSTPTTPRSTPTTPRPTPTTTCSTPTTPCATPTPPCSTPTTPCATPTPTCSTPTTPCSTPTTTCSTTPSSANNGRLQFLSSSRDCVSLDEGTILLAYGHCRRYYVCTNRRASLTVCRPGYWFDQDTRTCRRRRLVTNCLANRN